MGFFATAGGLATVGAMALLAALVGLAWWSRRDRTGPARIATLVKRGRLGEAAGLARAAGDLPTALDLYLRAQDSGNAADIAFELGDVRQAATLYGRAGNWERALKCYGQAGPDRGGDEPRRSRLTPMMPGLLGPSPATAAPDPAASAPTPVDEGGLATWRAVALVALPPPAPPRAAAAAPPSAPATRAAADAAAAPPPPPVTRDAADAFLAEGDAARAAQLFAEIGLDDEATHVFVNVLGQPGHAAPLVARQGHHERAAELYELAGEHERAALAWVDVARAANQPETLLERIGELSPEVALAYLDQETRARPLSPATAEWHYQRAKLLDQGGDRDQALAVLTELRAVVGPYRDVEQRLADLRAGDAPPPPTRPPRPPRPAIELPPELEVDDDELQAAAAGVLATTQLEQLVMQVAESAVDHLRRRAELSSLPELEALELEEPDAGPPVGGLERGPLDHSLLGDRAVVESRGGPGLVALQRFTGGRECDLGNIEVFYRLGLHHQADGNFDDALVAYDAVEDTSPAYRDAWKRAAALRGWKRATARVARLAASDDDAGGERYELRGELGRGRVAVVYRVLDRRLGHDVALKFLSDELSRQSAVRAAVEREARLATALNHPNLVTVHDAGTLAGRAFVAMELVDGQPVAELMRQPGGLTIVESLRLMKQVLAGLAHAHAHDLVHGNLKPANIVRTASGLVKVLDLGVARALAAAGQPAALAGTPAYLAPEQLDGGAVDAQADVFAAAVTLYELLSGHRPFAGADRQTAPRRPSELVPAIPAPLEDAIMRGLALDRAQRWTSTAELAGKVDQLLDAIDGHLRRRGRPPASAGG